MAKKTTENRNEQWERMRSALIDAGQRCLWSVTKPTGKDCTFDLECWNTAIGLVIFQVWRPNRAHGGAMGFGTYHDGILPNRMDALIEVCTVSVEQRRTEPTKRTRLCVLSDGETYTHVSGAVILDCPDDENTRAMIDGDDMRALRESDSVEVTKLF